MNKKSRIQIMSQLGAHLAGGDEYLEALMKRTTFANPWFTLENQKLALRLICENWLQEEQMEHWLANGVGESQQPKKKIALLPGGHSPLNGFYDLMSIFLVGHHCQVKLDKRDPYLLPYFIQLLNKWDDRTQAYFSVVNQFKDFDGVMVHSDQQVAAQLQKYFGRYPNIIRQGTRAVAVLEGNESAETLRLLGKDVFRFFGLNNRNVSKLLVPEGYDFEALLEALHAYRDVIQHSRYKNNFDYNYSLLILNKVTYMANGCIILREGEEVFAPIACMYYEYYKDKEDLKNKLQAQKETTECVVGNSSLVDDRVAIGKALEPTLAEQIGKHNVLDFLLKAL